MKRGILILTVLTFSMACISCFNTEWYQPLIGEYGLEYRNLTIPSEDKVYEIPFKFNYYVTKTSVPNIIYQIRSRILINDIPGEVYDASGMAPVSWDWGPAGQKVENGFIEAIFMIDVPANETADIRKICAQISIDRNPNNRFSINENVEHDWGEWITLLDGIQAGKQ